MITLIIGVKNDKEVVITYIRGSKKNQKEKTEGLIESFKKKKTKFDRFITKTVLSSDEIKDKRK